MVAQRMTLLRQTVYHLPLLPDPLQRTPNTVELTTTFLSINIFCSFLLLYSLPWAKSRIYHHCWRLNQLGTLDRLISITSHILPTLVFTSNVYSAYNIRY